MLTLALVAFAVATGGTDRDELMALDSAHAAATASRGLAEGFTAYLANDAIYLQPGSGYVQGRERIRTFLASQPAGIALRFRPARAVASVDGRVGYTFGWTELTVPGAGVRYGKYISFWRRQADGGWKVEAWNRSGGLDEPASAPAGPEEPPAATPGSYRAVDEVAEVRSLLAVDAAFAAASLARGAAEAFYEYAAPQGVSLGGGKDFVVGAEAIRQDQAAGAVPGQVLSWTPALGAVGPRGDLGWTVGTYVFTVPDSGKTRRYQGKYLTVWTRTAAGTWRFAVDGGSGNPPPVP